MDVRELYTLIEEIPQNELDIRIYFTRKKQNGTYQSYSPTISSDLQKDLKEIITNALENEFDTEQIPFSPVGTLNNCIEIDSVNNVNNFKDVIRSMDEENVNRGGINSDEIQKLNFYCVKIGIPEQGDAFFFRRVTKFRKFNKGIIGRFISNDFEKVQSNLLGIDPSIDIVVFKDEMLIIHHVAFERIFSMQDQYYEKAQETLNKIEEAGKIQNFDEFKSDCLSDARITRALAKLLAEEERIDKFIINFENVRGVIDAFELDIKIENGVLIYEDKSQLMDIVRLIRDSYYKSLIAQRMGIDEQI